MNKTSETESFKLSYIDFLIYQRLKGSTNALTNHKVLTNLARYAIHKEALNILESDFYAWHDQITSQEKIRFESLYKKLKLALEKKREFVV